MRCRSRARLRLQSSNYLHVDVKGGVGWETISCSMRALLQICKRIWLQQKDHRRIWGKTQLFAEFRITQHKWKAPQETKSCLPKAPCELQLGISVWERHLPGTSNLGYLLHGASQGGKRISPKTSLKLYLSLELPVSTTVKEQLFGKCLHNQFSLRIFQNLCVVFLVISML